MAPAYQYAIAIAIELTLRGVLTLFFTHSDGICLLYRNSKRDAVPGLEQFSTLGSQLERLDLAR